ncbi:hypothetical protein [Alkaliphilus sp. B6464]|nr:hypothetical protein [Alkaliphilus sp. B6464]
MKKAYKIVKVLLILPIIVFLILFILDCLIYGRIKRKEKAG